MFRSSFVASIALVLAVGLVLAACDSGVDPSSVTPPNPSPTIAFESSILTTSERDGTVSINVELTNPDGSEVSAEVLYAAAASSASIGDFNVTGAEEIGDGSAYVVETVTFPSTAEDGATRTLTFDLADEEDETEDEVGIFALQNVSGATIGSINELRVTINGEGTVQLLSADFSEDTLDPFTAISLASTENWGTASFDGADNSPYAQANGFGADEASNDWLISPAFDLSTLDGASLSFINAKNFDDSGIERGLLVKVSTDYDGEGNPEDFTWTDISDAFTYSGGDFEFVESGTYTFTDDLLEEEVYVAFQYISSGTGPGTTELWQVDNIVINAEE